MPLPVSLWHMRADLGANQSPVSDEMWTNEMAPLTGVTRAGLQQDHNAPWLLVHISPLICYNWHDWALGSRLPRNINNLQTGHDDIFITPRHTSLLRPAYSALASGLLRLTGIISRHRILYIASSWLSDDVTVTVSYHNLVGGEDCVLDWNIQ